MRRPSFASGFRRSWISEAPSTKGERRFTGVARANVRGWRRAHLHRVAARLSVGVRPAEARSRPGASVYRGARIQIMASKSPRDQILEALQDLPADASFDDAIERLVFLAKIQSGLAELDAGKGIPHDEVKRRLGA